MVVKIRSLAGTGWTQMRHPCFQYSLSQKLLGEECEAYMGLADIHQYHPSADAFHDSDLVLMVGARLDNQMNFDNPPLFPILLEDLYQWLTRN